jgi:hypothetical protein
VLALECAKETGFVKFQELGIPVGDIISQMTIRNARKLLFHLDWKGALCFLKEQ